MASQQLQMVYRSFFPLGGITTGLDFERKGSHEVWFTERGEIVTQCSQQNDIQIFNLFALRPREYRMLGADQETERVNIDVQTTRNTQGNDNRPECYLLSSHLLPVQESL
ncbi:unnamed protein product [Pocillopora meandrina]|uniref:Uncharacterized protein n=1 Tax=Pocillopora meandrina TaxID=46732 RepID=A0AAU9W6S0_9CNID|nr:uncharacterized protein LOC131778163 [Pocillopora verrucosa]XP_058950540.1 uncharacterized protein LOC131778163 [Pocillopora verrucosa]CAH3106231.1 unnamed protein product [Pocillopora meandrina]